MPGVLKVVRDGSFLAVVAEREFQAVQAMRALAQAASGTRASRLPAPATLLRLRCAALPSQDYVIHDSRSGVGPAGAHARGASTADPTRCTRRSGRRAPWRSAEDGTLTVWTHSQGVYPLRDAIAEMLRMPQGARALHPHGRLGCYGHNGADDVAAPMPR